MMMRLVLALPFVLMLSDCICGRETTPSTGPANTILISLDILRADRLAA